MRQKAYKANITTLGKACALFLVCLYKEKFHLGKEGVCVQGGSNYNQAFALTGDFHRFLAHLQ